MARPRNFDVFSSFMAEQNKQQRQPSETEQILGRPPGTPPEKVPPAEIPGVKKQINPKWQKHYTKLLKIRDYLIDQHRDLESKAVENQPEFAREIGDAGTESFLRDFALGMISNYQEMLYEVEEAIGRIESDRYGTCELTGKPIAPERLDAVPWTRFTTEAEAQLEKEGRAPFHAALAASGSAARPGTQRAAPDAARDNRT
jgi:RNA polymerase-binding transcription factor DksA